MENQPRARNKNKNLHIFQLCYEDLCNNQNLPMLFGVKAHLHKRVLDFNGDRVKLDEWRPILKALSLDCSLHFIAIRSRQYYTQILENIDTETKARMVVKKPVLITRLILKRLVDSLSRCLSSNTHLTCIELDGLFLKGSYLESLAVGLRRSVSLQHLSFHRCSIGDQGCQLISSCLRDLPSVVSLDLSGCDISVKGVDFISSTLQYQNLNRYGENWKQSLRYRTPNPEVMPGLRRVTLNHNPHIGDAGLQKLVDVIKDDLWLKALDLQNVGITSGGGRQILDLLLINKTLAIVDVRNNCEVESDLLTAIMYQLACNNSNRIPEYHWLKDDAVCLPRKPSYLNCNTVISKRSALLRLPSQDHCSHTNFNKCALVNSGIHTTTSNVLPVGSPAAIQLRKTASASGATHSCSRVGIPGRIQARLNHRRSIQAGVTVGVPNVLHSQDGPALFNNNIFGMTKGAGDFNIGHCNYQKAQARLVELSAHLEEEIQKRQAAEREKADLQSKLASHLQELHEIQSALKGVVLVDKKFMDDINSVFEDINRLDDLLETHESDSTVCSSLTSGSSSGNSSEQEGLADERNIDSSQTPSVPCRKTRVPKSHGYATPSTVAERISVDTAKLREKWALMSKAPNHSVVMEPKLKGKDRGKMNVRPLSANSYKMQLQNWSQLSSLQRDALKIVRHGECGVLPTSKLPKNTWSSSSCSSKIIDRGEQIINNNEDYGASDHSWATLASTEAMSGNKFE